MRIGHRASEDFDFFSAQSFDPDRLARDVPYLAGAERVQMDANTLTCRVERGGPVLLSFFGALGLGQAAPEDQAAQTGLRVASLLDLAATKAAVVQKRAQAKDYIDIAQLIEHGIDLPTALAAARAVYGNSFNPLITLKALTYFDDVPDLPAEVRARLRAAVGRVDVTRLPAVTPFKAPATKDESS